MTQASRIRDIVAILESSVYPVPRERFLNELEISLATFKRDLDVLRLQMQAPIVWKPGENETLRGYFLEDKGWSSGKLGLPKAWFSASEIYALLMINELASHIGPGLLSEHMQPLITRVSMMLSAAEDSPRDVHSRVKILTSASKRSPGNHFEAIAMATVRRKRIFIRYFTRSRDSRSERVVSPQLLLHFKENWYLLAWCHSANGLRMFALDSVEEAKPIGEAAQAVARTKLNEAIGKDFGIYGGQHRQWAKLHFSASQAPWVQSENWHVEQRGYLQEDGSYRLDVPYGNPKEIIMEIMKFGADVEVISPPALRQQVAERLQLAANKYAD